MKHQTFKFQPGVCSCQIDVENAASRSCDVLALNERQAILAPDSELVLDQLVSAKVKLGEFSVDIGGVVTGSDPGSVVLTWEAESFKAVDKLNDILKRIALKKRGNAPALTTGAPTAPDGEISDQKLARIKSASKNAKVSNIVGQDGRLDVGASLKKEAKTVRAAELASRVDTVQVLNMSTIKRLIKNAVNEAVVLLGPTLEDNERQRLLEQAEEGFREQVKAFQAEKAGLESQARVLQEQLNRAQEVLDQERQRVISADQFTVSDAGIIELEKRLGRMLDRAVGAGGVSAEIEGDMREIVGKLLDDERDKISQKAQEAQNDKIALLESKVNRLAQNLEETSLERDRAQRRAQVLETTGGAIRGSVMEGGLKDEDPDKDKKLALLKELISFNREIREDVAACAGDGDVKSVTSGTPSPIATAARQEPPEPEAEGPAEEDSEEEDSSDEETHLVVPEQAEDAELDIDATDADELEGAETKDGIHVPPPPGTDGVNPDDQLWEPPARVANDTVTTFKRLG